MDDTAIFSASIANSLPENSEARIQLARLAEFLETAPLNWEPGTKMKRFYSFGETICCVFWQNRFYMTGTDIVRSMSWKFALLGIKITNRKKFEEGIFSDLRNLKPGKDAVLEAPRSPFLDFLYKMSCIRTHKKQKVFFWFSIPHDKLFQDAFRREQAREIAPVIAADTLLSLSLADKGMKNDHNYISGNAIGEKGLSMHDDERKRDATTTYVFVSHNVPSTTTTGTATTTRNHAPTIEINEDEGTAGPVAAVVNEKSNKKPPKKYIKKKERSVVVADGNGIDKESLEDRKRKYSTTMDTNFSLPKRRNVKIAAANSTTPMANGTTLTLAPVLTNTNGNNILHDYNYYHHSTNNNYKHSAISSNSKSLNVGIEDRNIAGRGIFHPMQVPGSPRDKNHADGSDHGNSNTNNNFPVNHNHPNQNQGNVLPSISQLLNSNNNNSIPAPITASASLSVPSAPTSTSASSSVSMGPLPFPNSGAATSSPFLPLLTQQQMNNNYGVYHHQGIPPLHAPIPSLFPGAAAAAPSTSGNAAMFGNYGLTAPATGTALWNSTANTAQQPALSSIQPPFPSPVTVTDYHPYRNMKENLPSLLRNNNANNTPSLLLPTTASNWSIQYSSCK